jgi:polysaccharide biosynthesis protein PslG
MKRTPIFLAAALAALVLLAPAAPAERAPTSFAGMSPQGPTDDHDYELMRSSGVRSVRLALTWAAVQRDGPFSFEPGFAGFDGEVELAAKHGIRILPFLWGSPRWLSSESLVQPISSGWQLRSWARFLRAAVRRYGPEGTFWARHSDLPYLPIRIWEVWNEQNIVTFSDTTSPADYARLLRVSGRVLHRIDPGSRVIVGGLFGRPLQIPPNTGSGEFLAGLYRIKGMKRYFDGVALHPYVADARAMRAQIRNLRRIMRLNHDGRTPLYLTEIGWGSDSYESRWERGLYGQARELNEAMSMLVRNRRNWRIGGLWWFSWADLPKSCQFCDSAGLLTADREAKPAWYRFNFWTGGDADTVPRANVREARNAPGGGRNHGLGR